MDQETGSTGSDREITASELDYKSKTQLGYTKEQLIIFGLIVGFILLSAIVLMEAKALNQIVVVLNSIQSHACIMGP